MLMPGCELAQVREQFGAPTQRRLLDDSQALFALFLFNFNKPGETKRDVYQFSSVQISAPCWIRTTLSATAIRA